MKRRIKSAQSILWVLLLILSASCSKDEIQIEEIIEREVAEAVPEGELSQPDDQAGSMADHFH